jgi:hypothetical protein
LKLAWTGHVKRVSAPDRTIVLPIVGELTSKYNGVDLYTHEILAGCFGFSALDPKQAKTFRLVLTCDAVGGRQTTIGAVVGRLWCCGL